MKKNLAVFGAILLFAFIIPRPAAAEVDFDLGVKGGLSLAKIKFDEAGEDFCSLKKPVFGAFLSLNLHEFFSIQPEIFFLRHGGMIEEVTPDYTYKYEIVLSYIHIPVLVKTRLMTEGQVRPILFAGPSFGFLTKAVDRYYEEGAQGDEDDIKEYLKSTNFSAVFGGGVEISLETMFLVLEIRYDLGFSNINKAEESIKTNALMIVAGVGF
jgi:hypothetical protein